VYSRGFEIDPFDSGDSLMGNISSGLLKIFPFQHFMV
jgi:hypothetical protein